MEELKSKCGKMQFSHEGCIYLFDRSSADRSKKYWRRQLKNECKVRFPTTADSNEVVTQMNQHTQGSRPVNV